MGQGKLGKILCHWPFRLWKHLKNISPKKPQIYSLLFPRKQLLCFARIKNFCLQVECRNWMSKGKFHESWQMLMGLNLHNQQHSASLGEVRWWVKGRRERKRVQAVISGGNLGRNMFRIQSLLMILAEMPENIYLVGLLKKNGTVFSSSYFAKRGVGCGGL